MSCNSNIRTNIVSESDKENLSKIVRVKLRDYFHNPGEMTWQMMVLKEHVKAKYRLTDLIRENKKDKMTNHLSKWTRAGEKEKEDLEEDNLKILSQFYKERKGLPYHTADVVVACRAEMKKNNCQIYPHHTTAAVSDGGAVQVA